jgi:4a-hydroxytetrahydrobiopterin dehydratase
MAKHLETISESEARELLSSLPGWELGKGGIGKRFVFDTFPEAIWFVGNLVPFFEKEDHHPDIHISYKEVLFELTTHEAGNKLTALDFSIAGKIEEEFGDR